MWAVEKLYNKLKFSQEDGGEGVKNSFKILFKEKRLYVYEESRSVWLNTF